MPKIIQTFWIPEIQKNNLLHSGGFLCPEIHYMSWAFSCLQLLKFHGEVTLHTNLAGKKILIDLLELPYTKVYLSLETDFINNLLPSMWAYCKIHTYSIQTEAFLHIDGDVFIWKPFEANLMQAPLIAQNIDGDLDVYKQCLQVIKSKASFVPDWIHDESLENRAYNAGLVGGSNLDFFKEYTQLAFDFYEKNKHHFDDFQKKNKHIHIIPEQFLMYVLSKKRYIDASLQSKKIVESNNGEFSHFFDIDTKPLQDPYMHLLANCKKSKVHNDFVSFILKESYADVWQKIIAVFENNNCLSDYMKRQIAVTSQLQTKTLPQVTTLNDLFKGTKYFCEQFKIDFELGKRLISSNSKLNDLYLFENAVLNFDKKVFDKIDIKTSPFPTYKTETNVFEKHDYKEYQVSITPYHEIIITDFAWNEGLKATTKEALEALNPFRSIALLYLDMHYFSSSYIWLNDSLLYLLEQIKSTPTTIETLLQLQGIQHDANNDMLSLLKKWYAYGIIQLSKSDFIKQENTPIYLAHQHNIKTQVSSCLKYLVNFYKKKTFDSKLISQFDNPQKVISLQEIIKTLVALNFEANGVRTNIDNIHKITTPAIALIKLRNQLNMHVIIEEITNNHITIYNPENKKQESYEKSYFSTIWDGILILIKEN